MSSGQHVKKESNAQDSVHIRAEELTTEDGQGISNITDCVSSQGLLDF